MSSEKQNGSVRVMIRNVFLGSRYPIVAVLDSKPNYGSQSKLTSWSLIQCLLSNKNIHCDRILNNIISLLTPKAMQGVI